MSKTKILLTLVILFFATLYFLDTYQRINPIGRARCYFYGGSWYSSNTFLSNYCMYPDEGRECTSSKDCTFYCLIHDFESVEPIGECRSFTPFGCHAPIENPTDITCREHVVLPQ